MTSRWKTQNRTTLVAASVMCMVFGVAIAPAAAQQTTVEVLSFLADQSNHHHRRL